MGLERGVRPCLVNAHHPRVTRDVGANYGSQASFHLRRLCISALPKTGEVARVG
jgi:hypothetical protein